MMRSGGAERQAGASGLATERVVLLTFHHRRVVPSGSYDGIATKLDYPCRVDMPSAEVAAAAMALRGDPEILQLLNQRIVDLLPIARERYYHPSQHGSWSIKAVLPAVVPELNYSDLDGVQDGGMAMEAFLEALHPETPEERKRLLREQLLTYCKLDTYAMVRLWQVFSGRTDLSL